MSNKVFPLDENPQALPYIAAAPGAGQENRGHALRGCRVVEGRSLNVSVLSIVSVTGIHSDGMMLNDACKTPSTALNFRRLIKPANGRS